ncbi:MAG: hypothetical protein ACERKN_09420 [Velocimicrobium sp.]
MEMKQENKIIEFDQNLAKLEDYTILMGKMVRYIFEALLFVSFAIPFHAMEGLYDSFFCFIATILMGATYFYMRSYLQISENGSICSLYQKLKFFPVSAKAVWEIRCQYVLRYARKMEVCFLVIQVAITLISGEKMGIWSFFYPSLMVLLFVIVFGILISIPRKRNR